MSSIIMPEQKWYIEQLMQKGLELKTGSKTAPWREQHGGKQYTRESLLPSALSKISQPSA